MKKQFLKIGLFFLFFMFTALPLYAQPSSEGDGMDEYDEPVAPIDSEVCVLLAAGVAFAYYRFRKSPSKSLA
jgi:hypothetical protein